MSSHLPLQCSSSAPVSDHYADVAWHLLTVLLRLRRPAHPTELASDSTSPFAPLSLSLIRFLSRIPGSPLHLRQDGLITVSAGATAAFLAFAVADFSRIAVEVPLWSKIWSSSGLSFRKSMGRKRKGGELFSIAKRRLTVAESEDRAEENDLVSGSGIADKGLVFNIHTTHAVKSSKALFNKSHAHHDDLVMLNEDHATISLPDIDASPLSDSCNGIHFGKGKGAIKLKRCQPGGSSLVHKYEEVPSLPEQQLEHYNSHDFLTNGNATDFGELVAKEPLIFTKEVISGVSAAKPGEHVPSVSQNIGIALQQDFNGFSSDALGRRSGGDVVCGGGLFSDNDKGSRMHNLEDEDALWAADASLGANVVSGGGLLDDEKGCRTHNIEDGGTLPIANAASGGELLFDDEKGSRLHNLDDEDAHCASGAMLDPNVDVPWASIHYLDNTLVEIQVDHAFAKREATFGSSASKKSSIKDDCLVSATKKGSTNSLGCNEVANNGTQVEIRKKYARRRLKVQNHGSKEKIAESEPDVSKDQVKTNKFPQFDAFIVEDEEGSGGYGTVYKAQRKDDGKTFAVKCPHSNAHSYHINNELKMLERFGGRSFIIRLEGSFEREKSECFVLEHVDHDRPEVLKREMEVSELQWYCYCLFKALSSLHKQGVVHRDVKPGNFLFSRKVGKGYLIDFNLALDLHHKHRLNNRYDLGSNVGPAESSLRKVTPPTSSRKTLHSPYPESGRRDSNKELKRLSLSQSRKKGTEKGRLDGISDFNSRHKNKNQVAADGSGLTSVKDATSNRTPSAERMREPIPCRGRKELLSLVQEVMHSPRQKSPPPISQRKRIPAPLGKAERLVALLTPMPLQMNGSPISNGQLKIKGAKERTDGPCVGTKGFRAPEVLLRSRYQNCKLDVWSAGVTLLYMIIGRVPFSGDPEQNIKEIAKMKGSEDLWELAKIHDRESSFPTELLDIRCLQPVKLREWCKKNTKRPEFLDRIPDALFDLVERCLVVNPRLRISSEEALIHDFLSPCREELRKQRIIRVSRESQMELHSKLELKASSNQK